MAPRKSTGAKGQSIAQSTRTTRRTRSSSQNPDASPLQVMERDPLRARRRPKRGVPDIQPTITPEHQETKAVQSVTSRSNVRRPATNPHIIQETGEVTPSPKGLSRVSSHPRSVVRTHKSPIPQTPRVSQEDSVPRCSTPGTGFIASEALLPASKPTYPDHAIQNESIVEEELEGSKTVVEVNSDGEPESVDSTFAITQQFLASHTTPQRNQPSFEDDIERFRDFMAPDVDHGPKRNQLLQDRRNAEEGMRFMEKVGILKATEISEAGSDTEMSSLAEDIEMTDSEPEIDSTPIGLIEPAPPTPKEPERQDAGQIALSLDVAPTETSIATNDYLTGGPEGRAFLDQVRAGIADRNAKNRAEPENVQIAHQLADPDTPSNEGILNKFVSSIRGFFTPSRARPRITTQPPQSGDRIQNNQLSSHETQTPSLESSERIQRRASSVPTKVPRRRSQLPVKPKVTNADERHRQAEAARERVQILARQQSGQKRKIRVDDLPSLPARRKGQSSGTYSLVEEVIDEDEVDESLIESPLRNRRRRKRLRMQKNPPVYGIGPSGNDSVFLKNEQKPLIPSGIPTNRAWQSPPGFSSSPPFHGNPNIFGIAANMQSNTQIANERAHLEKVLGKNKFDLTILKKTGHIPGTSTWVAPSDSEESDEEVSAPQPSTKAKETGGLSQHYSRNVSIPDASQHSLPDSSVRNADSPILQDTLFNPQGPMTPSQKVSSILSDLVQPSPQMIAAFTQRFGDLEQYRDGVDKETRSKMHNFLKEYFGGKGGLEREREDQSSQPQQIPAAPILSHAELPRPLEKQGVQQSPSGKDRTPFARAKVPRLLEEKGVQSLSDKVEEQRKRVLQYQPSNPSGLRNVSRQSTPSVDEEQSPRSAFTRSSPFVALPEQTLGELAGCPPSQRALFQDIHNVRVTIVDPESMDQPMTFSDSVDLWDNDGAKHDANCVPMRDLLMFNFDRSAVAPLP